MRSLHALRAAAALALAAAAALGTAATASAADQYYAGHFAYVQDCGMTGSRAVAANGSGAYWNAYACYGTSSGYDLYMVHQTPPAPVWRVTDSWTIGYQPTISSCVSTGLSYTSYNSSSSYWNQFSCPASGATGYTLILQHGQYV